MFEILHIDDAVIREVESERGSESGREKLLARVVIVIE